MGRVTVTSIFLSFSLSPSACFFLKSNQVKGIKIHSKCAPVIKDDMGLCVMWTESGDGRVRLLPLSPALGSWRQGIHLAINKQNSIHESHYHADRFRI